jgi:putative FMN-dependent luciferase-like monooxygenase
VERAILLKACRLGFFTRLLDRTDAGERYRLATEQIACAERHGFESAWVAQHHFVETEGGLPSPFVFLAQVAARTTRIRLGTGIVTLPLESPLRVAEDAAVLDLLAGGRLEIGVGPGGTPSAFESFGEDSAKRADIFDRHLQLVRAAWSGEPLGGGVNRLYPAAPHLVDRLWQATFSVEGGARAGRAGDGLMLSRTQPRPDSAPQASLAAIQNPIIDAYLASLPAGRAPRIMGSRSVFIADDRRDAKKFALAGLRRFGERLRAAGRHVGGDGVEDLIAASDAHVGTPDDVIASLGADRTLDRVTDLVVQVHSMDPPHPLILRSIELMADRVAPSLGWRRPAPAAPAPRAVVGARP